MGDRPHLCTSHLTLKSLFDHHRDAKTDQDEDLHMLHTDPDFQKRDAGTSLVEWDTHKADELGLPAYLESSVAGHHLYQSQGFEDIDTLKVDLSPWNGPHYEHHIMIREPHKLQPIAPVSK